MRERGAYLHALFLAYASGFQNSSSQRGKSLFFPTSDFQLPNCDRQFRTKFDAASGIGMNTGLLHFGPEGHNVIWIGRHIGTVDQINAVGNRWHHGVKALVDGLWPAGQVNDKALTTDPGCLPRENRCGNILQRDLPH